jgi:hypothetical protein
MADPTETWSERFEREFDAVRKLGHRRPLLAGAFLLAIAFYGWHLFGPSLSGISLNDLVDKDPPTKSQGPSIGASGWIYVGSRDASDWKKFDADGIEPTLTLETNGLPTRGASYTVVASVYLRDDLPKTRAGARPVMANSNGTILAGSQVKVDDVTQLSIPDPPRIWVWAHVTLVR